MKNVRRCVKAERLARARRGRVTHAIATLEYVAKMLNAQSEVDILHVP